MRSSAIPRKNTRTYKQDARCVLPRIGRLSARRTLCPAAAPVVRLTGSRSQDARRGKNSGFSARDLVPAGHVPLRPPDKGSRRGIRYRRLKQASATGTGNVSQLGSSRERRENREQSNIPRRTRRQHRRHHHENRRRRESHRDRSHRAQLDAAAGSRHTTGQT